MAFKELSHRLQYEPDGEGNVAVAMVGDAVFNSYPAQVRTRVRLSMTLGHTPQESDKLHAAFAKSPGDYIKALDEVLCARAEGFMQLDAERIRTAKRRDRER
jgi:hypothetical protein